MAAVEEKSGRYSLSEVREFGRVKKGYTQFINGDLIFAKITPCMENGKIAVVDNLENGIGFGSTEFHVSRLTKLTNRKYLFYYLIQETFSRNARQHLTGSAGQLRLPKSYFAEVLIPLAPLDEQQRIVEKLEELFSDLGKGIENLKTAQKQLKVYRQAVLKWALEGKLTEKWRSQVKQEQSAIKTGDELLAQITTEREKLYQQQFAEWEEAVKKWEANGKPGNKPSKPQKPKRLSSLTEAEITELPKLPDGWCWANLGHLKQFSLYGPRFSSQDYVDDGILVLRTSDISELGKVDFKKAPKLPLTKEEYEKYKLVKGDLLITRTGSIGTISVFNDTVRAIPGAFLIHYRLLAPINVWFIFYFLKSFKAQQHFKDKSAGVGRPNLNVPNIEELKISIPSFEEQEEIVQEIESRLSICDQLETTIIENLQKAEALQQSILKQAFEGKLVPQDPNDDPAEKLLEGIRAERQAKAIAKDKSQSIYHQLTIQEI